MGTRPGSSSCIYTVWLRTWASVWHSSQGLLHKLLQTRTVYGMQLINQHNISLDNIRNTYLALASFAQEFEEIYCQRLVTWIHFVRPCLHFLVHLPHEVICLGPPICSSQWTLERTIGNLGEKIKQHSNLFGNLSQCRIRRAQVNALKAMIPRLDTERSDGGYLPYRSKDLGNGYVLLRACESDPHPFCDWEVDALYEYLGILSLRPKVPVRRWAKLCIPTGQNCYSAWKETQKPLEKWWTAQNVKVHHISTAKFLAYWRVIRFL